MNTATPKIITNYDPKPVPARQFDWSAVRDGYDGGDAWCGGDVRGDAIGYGRTEQEAIADLLEQEDADLPETPEMAAERRDTLEAYDDLARWNDAERRGDHLDSHGTGPRLRRSQRFCQIV